MLRAQAFNPIRSLESAWKLVIKAPLPLAVGGLIMVVVQQTSGVGFQFGNNPQLRFQHGDFASALPVLGPLMIFGLALFLALYGVVAWLSVGYYNGVATVMRTGSLEFSELFNSRGRWLNALLARLLRDVISIAGLGLFVIPILAGVLCHELLDLDVELGFAVAILGGLALLPVLVYLWLGLVFVPQAVALAEIGPVEAVGRSWRLAHGRRWPLFLYSLLTAVIGVVGLVLCCFGGLQASGILIEVMWTEAYVQATTGPETNGWWMCTGVAGEPPDAPAVGWPEPPLTPSATAEAAPPDEGGFDPGAWRDEAGIPPLDDEDRPS